MAQIRTILSVLAYAPPTLATIFDFELVPKKVVSDPPEVFEFHFFHWFKLDLVKMAK